MHFVYEGFTQDGCRRYFSFLGVNEREPEMKFLIEVNLEMLGKYSLSVQEGPLFCQDLLTKALLTGAVSLEKLQKYAVVCDDLRPILVEREKREAEKEMKRRYRSAYRKPPVTSNLVLSQGANSGRNAV